MAWHVVAAHLLSSFLRVFTCMFLLHMHHQLPTLVYNRHTHESTLFDSPLSTPDDATHTHYDSSHWSLYLTQHRATLQPLIHIIIRTCHQRLQRRELRIEEYADALACVMIMQEDMTMQQLLMLFLQSRTTWVRGHEQACVWKCVHGNVACTSA